MNEMNRLNQITDYKTETRMMTALHTVAEEDKLNIPLDVSEWCPKPKLLAWIQEELDTLNWSNPELIAYLRTHPGYQPRMWLILLTFGYVTGNFESEEIVRLCYVDPIFRSICTEAAPSPSELGRFRRE